MARHGSKLHKWTEDELKLLLETIREATPMLEHYNRQGYKQVDWWASVSGMLFQKGGPIVTGKACARQFDYLIESEQQLPEVQEEKDQWRIVEDLVDEYEQSILESVDTRLEKAEQRLASVASVVDSLARELGVKETWE